MQSLINAFESSISAWWIPLVVWELVWKGIALWKSARHKQLYWFLAILIFNTAGILPIVYLWLFQPKGSPPLSLRAKSRYRLSDGYRDEAKQSKKRLPRRSAPRNDK